jgi:hypothetical protein
MYAGPKTEDLNKCRDLESLNRLVAREAARRGVDAKTSWDVLAIDQIDVDEGFSRWLRAAAKRFKVLKRRVAFVIV